MQWYRLFRSFFAPPVFADDPEKTQRARNLNMILNAAIVATLFLLLGNLFGSDAPTFAYWLNVVGFLFTLPLRWWLHRGYVQSTAVVLLVAIFTLSTIGNVALGTIRTPTAAIYILIVIIGGILFGQRGAIITTGLSSLSILALILAQNAGLLPEPDMSVGITQWVTYSVLIAVSGLLTSYTLHIVQQALNQARQELALRRQAEATIKEQEAFLTAITSNIHEMIVLVSPDGRLKYMNQAFERLLGYRPTDLIGSLAFELMHPEDSKQQQLLLAQALNQGNVDTLSLFRVRHANGHYLWVEASAQFIHEEEVGITGIVSVVRDVTAQQETAEQIRLLSRAVEASPVSIVMSDVNGRITYTNPKFTEISGYTFAEAYGQNPRILKSGKTPPETYRELWQTILAGQTWSGEFLNQRKDGSLYWEWAIISPIIDPGSTQITHFVAIKEDITQRKQMEMELRRSNAELQVRNQELDAFAHTVAHDLKSPMGIIAGFGELLQESHAAMPPEQLHTILRTMTQSARKATDIIESLLLLASARQQDVVLVPLPMPEILLEVRHRLENAIQASGANVQMTDVAAWPQALGHPAWVEAIWVNYLSNALKYSEASPKIVLGAELQQDGCVRFYVRDNGPGLTPEQQKRLFAPFERLNKSKVTGHGLGLSIVHRLAERMNGQVGVISQPGQGSTFYFTLQPAPQPVPQSISLTQAIATPGPNGNSLA